MSANATTIPELSLAALAFAQSQYATGSVLDDPFYTVSSEHSNAPAGTLLKLEKSTNTSLYSLPPATALSRLIYQSKTMNGLLVPVSALILWPFSPRTSSDGYQVVAWSHGTSGTAPNSAPSHLKNLWQHFLAPYQLALQGYVVVATDYAGLGVSKTASGEPITHQYLASPSHANDVFYSVQAAQSAFPELSKSFVIAGHSQGGASAWAAAQRQALDPVEGYLGAVAVSPGTNIVKMPEPFSSFIATVMCPGIADVMEGFKPDDILTSDGLARLELVKQLGGCTATTMSLLHGFELTKPGWIENEHVKRFQDMVENGGKKIAGPLLVIQGTVDPIVQASLTDTAVERTAEVCPDASIEYFRMVGAGHNAGLSSSQWVWMDWIAQRFKGIEAKPGMQSREMKAAVDVANYQAELNWWIKKAEVFWETP